MTIWKRSSVILFCLALISISQPVRAQKTAAATDIQIARIRAQYEAVDSAAKKYTVRKYEFAHETSNDNYTGYYENNTLRKIVVVSSGEYDQVTTKFYLQDGQVFFIHRIWTRFKTLGDNVGTATEQRLYFAQNRLIRWLGKDNAPKSIDSSEARTTVSALTSLRQEAVKALTQHKSSQQPQ